MKKIKPAAEERVSPLYDQSAIDTLQSRIAELEAERDEAHKRNYDQSTELFQCQNILRRLANDYAVRCRQVFGGENYPARDKELIDEARATLEGKS